MQDLHSKSRDVKDPSDLSVELQVQSNGKEQQSMKKNVMCV